jgi:hypothetical protein
MILRLRSCRPLMRCLRIPVHLADAKLHLSCLIACAQEVMEAYEARKKALGLIDFADMIAGAERLLRTDPAVRQAVSERDRLRHHRRISGYKPGAVRAAVAVGRKGAAHPAGGRCKAVDHGVSGGRPAPVASPCGGQPRRDAAP